MPPSNEFFYHGTNPSSAVKIAAEGFKMGEERQGRGLGYGLYTSCRKEFIPEWNWGLVVIKCKLKKGLQILWCNDAPEAKTIKYLRKEFGKEILTPKFYRALPNNKQLKKHELVAVIVHVMRKMYINKKLTKKRDSWLDLLSDNYSRMYKQLKFHNFDGIGFKDKNWPEILLFNPSDAEPHSFHEYTAKFDKDFYVTDMALSKPLTIERMKHLAFLADLWYNEDSDPEKALLAKYYKEEIDPMYMKL
jgi:hypothetical protein